jgi:glutamate/tyrosine decarboxylase-like PLP-dependent enzyme
MAQSRRRVAIRTAQLGSMVMGIEESELRARMRKLVMSGELLTDAAGRARRYLADADDRPVAPTAGAVAALERFREPLPESVGDAAKILAMLDEVGSPGTVAQTGARFFGLVNGGMVPAAHAARVLADAWDQNAAVGAVSPTNAVIEETCQAWLRDLFGLPEQTVAGFVSGTSLAIVCGLAAARWRLCERAGYDVNARGLADAPSLRIVASRHAHSTVLKAVALLGFGTDNIEWADVDDQGRLDPATLPELDRRTILILQAGNVNSGSFDPIRQCTERARSAGAWVHVDGAFGLWAAACASLTHLTDGHELADSWSVDGHKTLNTPYDCGISLCADPEAMVASLQNSAPYIVASEHRDGMLYTPEMSRRARAIDLWATLRYLGREGVDRMVLSLHERANQFAAELADAGFDVVNDVVFNQVMIRVGDHAATDRFAAAVQASGEAWVGGSAWFGEPVIRISVCSWMTSPEDVSRAVQAFVQTQTK